MLNSHHREAEKLATKAGFALRTGERAKAIRLYCRAAKKEEAAFNETPPAMNRTRAALAVSVVSLWYKGRCWKTAEKWVYTLLSDDSYGEATRVSLKELLEAVLDEQALENEGKAAYMAEGIELRLKGGQIGFGTAPLDPILHIYDGLRSLLYRAAEYIKQEPFRLKGLPIPAIREAIQARTTQPLPGSYRLFVQFIQPVQGYLFESPFVNPAEASQTLFSFVSNVAEGNQVGLAQAVSDEQYRRVMLKLLRNITPDGKQMREVEFVGRGSLNQAVVRITVESRDMIRQSLGDVATNDQNVSEVIGVLRGLNLDKRFLEVTVEEGKKRLYASDLLLDDVIGPMVNRRVRLIGVRMKRGRQLFQDIELADADASS